MKIMCYRQYGGPEVLEWLERPSLPLKPKELRVKVLGTSVNPIDWKIASGALRWIIPLRFPITPGSDLVGSITEVGQDVVGFTIGDAIIAKLGVTGGAVADEQVILAAQAVPLGGVDIKQAAGVPLAGMTALQCLRDSGGLVMSDSKQSVLIIGASGGVGHYAVQIARHSGAQVAAVCSTKNIDLVTSIGATTVYDYTQGSDFSGAGPYDLILVAAGDYPWSQLKTLLKPGGVVVEPTPAPAMLPAMAYTALFGPVRYRPFFLKDTVTDLRWLQFHLASGVIQTTLQRVLSFDQLAEAWQLSQQHRVVGKIVLLREE